MNTFKGTVHVGLGDIIYMKAQFDAVRHNYSKIELTFNKHWTGVHDKDYPQFLKELGQLLFSEPPYLITDDDHPHLSLVDIHNHYNIPVVKPELAHILCKGDSLNLDNEYVALSTKLRYFNRTKFNEIAPQFFEIINQLTNKYKVVVLGERIVEMNAEYQYWGANEIYSIYDDIINNIPPEKLVDLTIPVLGITTPKLSQIQQDCLILNKAKFAVTFGVGGNFCMATAVANTIGYRIDNDISTDVIYCKDYPNAIITKDYNKFLQTLQSYL
jgi:hypothetical protein